MPVSDHYFQKKDGTLVSRSIFDYIRDHLGYRIELQRLGMPQTIRNGEALTLNLEFINRGFAGFSSERPAYFVLIDEKEGIMELPVLCMDIMKVRIFIIWIDLMSMFLKKKN